jgi:hypothetical protein
MSGVPAIPDLVSRLLIGRLFVSCDWLIVCKLISDWFFLFLTAAAN